MARVTNLQWRDEQSGGKFPFADYATLTSRDGIVLAEDTFLDAHLYPIGGGAGLYITRVDVFSSTVRIYVGNIDNPTLCYGEFDPLDPPELLRLTDAYGRAAGVLVSPPLGLSIAQSWTQGTHLFDRVATEFVATVCCPQPAVGVRGFLTADNELLTGDVWIVGENGVVVREDPEVFVPGDIVLRIDIVGDPLFKRALCDGDANTPAGPVPLFASPPVLKTINNIPPTTEGGCVITVGTAAAADPTIRITTTPTGLIVALVGQPTENP